LQFIGKITGPFSRLIGVIWTLCKQVYADKCKEVAGKNIVAAQTNKLVGYFAVQQ